VAFKLATPLEHLFALNPDLEVRTLYNVLYAMFVYTVSARTQCFVYVPTLRRVVSGCFKRAPRSKAYNRLPQSSELGTYLQVKVRLWPWLSGEVIKTLKVVSSSLGSGRESEGRARLLWILLRITDKKDSWCGKCTAGVRGRWGTSTMALHIRTQQE